MAYPEKDLETYWRETYPDRAAWWHPETTIEADRAMRGDAIEIAVMDAAPRDRRTGITLTLSPARARRLADQILRALRTD